MKPIRLMSGFLTVGGWTMASRILGFVRDVLILALLTPGLGVILLMIGSVFYVAVMQSFGYYNLVGEDSDEFSPFFVSITKQTINGA